MSALKTAVIWLCLNATAHPQQTIKTLHRQQREIASVTAGAPVLDEQKESDGTHTKGHDEEKHEGLYTIRVATMPPRDAWDIGALLINAILAAIGIGGVAITVCTLFKIERQARAAETQARHIVVSERPFLMVDVLGDENHASFRLTNQGNSPAKIIFMDRLLAPTYLPVGEALPLIPNYGAVYRSIVDPNSGADAVNAVWVKPKGEEFIGSVSPKGEITLLRDSLPYGSLGPSAVWHFGVVVYKGLFSPTCYESRFCYRLLDNTWAMLGPYGYNEYS